MKKTYITPGMEVVEVRMSGMLCVSGELGGDASQDALVPSLSIEEDLGIDIGE